jgi:hypothetical protein
MRGKLDHSQTLILNFNQEIKELKLGKTYKYPGTDESDGIQHRGGGLSCSGPQHSLSCTCPPGGAK